MPPIASVDVPASSANLGSGFDAFAAALSLKLRAELYDGEEAGILLNVRGEGVPEPADDPDQNLVIRSFREGLRAAHGSPTGSGAWRIEVSSMIPAARGLGSSAAAIVAGLLLGATVGRSAPPVDDLLSLAASLEGHPDNVAAALYGGFTLAVSGEGDGPPLLRRFRVPDGWIPIVFVASASSRTEQMRDALPASIPHADAARQVARSALLATAIMTADASLLRRAMDDRLHQPYRLPLLAGASELIDVAYQHGAAGAALSGAGPSVIAICDSPITAHSVEKAWNGAGLDGMATRLRFDPSGARLIHAERSE